MANGQSPLGQLLQSIASSSTASTANSSQLLAELSRPGHSHLAQVINIANSQVVLQIGRQQLTLNSQALPAGIQQQLQQGARELLLFNPPANTQAAAQGPSQQANNDLWLLPLRAAQEGQLQLMNRQQPVVEWQLNARQRLILQLGSTTVELPRRLPPMVANFLASHGSLKLDFALTQPSATQQEPKLVVSLHPPTTSYQVTPRAQLPQLTMPLASPLAQQMLKFSEQGVSHLALNQLLQAMRQPSGFIAPLTDNESTFDATRLLQGRAASPQQVMQRIAELLQSAPTARDVNHSALAHAIKNLAKQYQVNATTAPVDAARPATAPPTAVQADAELQQLLTQLLAKSPQAEQLAQQPQALQHWVSQWFAARPLALQNNQQLGGLGQALLLLLGARLQQQQPQANAQQWLQHVQQWTQAASSQANKTSNVPLNVPTQNVDGGNLLSQASTSLVTRLLQTLGSAFASAQLSQSRLQDSSANQQPDYYILLPPAAQQSKQDELLIQRRKDRRKGRQQEDMWLFTLRLDTQRLGVIMAKGRYQQGHAQVDFYTNDNATQQQLETHLEVLQGRLQAQQIHQVDFSVQAGEIPDSLAEQASGVIRVSV